ncbi:MAG TPA: sigma-54 dependent transcriptional regulator [Acidobacteriota bacterium]|nr:sigma-54 dependent transcriptional regulator [Acidobacteriota bacterium]
MNRIRVLLVDDDDLLRKSLAKELRHSGFEVKTADNAHHALARVKAWLPDVVLLDIRLPDSNGLDTLKAIKRIDASVEVIMLTAYGTVDTAVYSLKAGAYHYLVKPAKLAEIDAAIHKAYEKRGLALENRALREKLRQDVHGDVIVGESPQMQRLLRLVERVAPSDRTVLIQGESGTGKELVARRIHRLSQRRDAPFVLVDCASLSKSLLESELFGHEKGAFTGAAGIKHGFLEAAHEGTLFVDEIGTLEPEIQSSFLRFLETGEYRRVGGTKIRQADLRIVAATNTDLSKAVQDGEFREDLYFRISVIVVFVPPLRERQGDIPLLARHFLERATFGDSPKELSGAALKELERHKWPGNVRELKNTIERAALLCDADRIQPWDLKILSSPAEKMVRRLAREEEMASLRKVESRYIHWVLERVGGNQQKAAEILGIDPKTLYRRLKKERE